VCSLQDTDTYKERINLSRIFKTKLPTSLSTSQKSRKWQKMLPIAQVSGFPGQTTKLYKKIKKKNAVHLNAFT